MSSGSGECYYLASDNMEYNLPCVPFFTLPLVGCVAVLLLIAVIVQCFILILCGYLILRGRNQKHRHEDVRDDNNTQQQVELQERNTNKNGDIEQKASKTLPSSPAKLPHNTSQTNVQDLGIDSMYDMVREDLTIGDSPQPKQIPAFKIEIAKSGTAHPNYANVNISVDSQSKTTEGATAKEVSSTLPPADVYDPAAGGSVQVENIQYAQVNKKKRTMPGSGDEKTAPPPPPPPLLPSSTCYDEVVHHTHQSKPAVDNSAAGYHTLDHGSRQRAIANSEAQDCMYDSIVEHKSGTKKLPISIASRSQECLAELGKLPHPDSNTCKAEQKRRSFLPTYTPNSDSMNVAAEPEYDIVAL